MSDWKRFVTAMLLLGMATGFVGWNRNCAKSCAENVGSDWIVVQYSAVGETLHCWRLKGVGITNEGHSDGIYWQAPSGNLVHISGWYNRIQIGGFRDSERWNKAAEDLHVNLAKCTE